MWRPSKQLLAIGGVLLLGGAWVWWLNTRSAGRPRDAGFWFEPVAYDSSALGGSVTAPELETVASIARAEVVRAFAGLPVVVSDRRDATYRVRVVQGLTDPMFRSDIEIAAIGRGIGRTAVHEFTHQFLPTAQIHGSDRQSYEFGSASRREPYYGEMRWDIAWPMLVRQLGGGNVDHGT